MFTSVDRKIIQKLNEVSEDVKHFGKAITHTDAVLYQKSFGSFRMPRFQNLLLRCAMGRVAVNPQTADKEEEASQSGNEPFLKVVR